MANSYNTMPIVLDTVMANGWRASQTLNTKQNGIIVTRVIWTGMSAAGHTFSIVLPSDNTILLTDTAGSTLSSVEYFNDPSGASWYDFKLSAISSGKLLIWYRY